MARIIRTGEGSDPIPQGFPVLVDEEMRIIEPAFDYLFECAVLRGRTASPSTTQAYAEQLVDWFDSLEQSNMDWRSVRKETLASYRRRHQEAPSPVTGRAYAASTINARLRCVCRFYKWAAETGWIKATPFPTENYRNPRAGEGFFAHTRAPRKSSERSPLTVSQPRARRRALSSREIDGLMQTLADPYRTMAAWGVTTGMRRMELCALTTTQIPDAMALREREGRLIEIHLTVTKGQRPRRAFAPIELIDRTQGYIEGARREAERRRKGKQSERLFLGPTGAPISRNRASNKFHEAVVRAGIEADLHCLRHTFAINAYHALTKASREHPEKNINVMMVLRDLLGHSSVAVTETYLNSLEMTPETIEPALAYLYGATIGGKTDEEDGEEW